MGKHEWTTAELRTLDREYPRRSTAAVAEMLGLRLSQVYNMAFVRGLKKTPEYLASVESGRLRKLDERGRQHRFQPGHKTWNAGLKGIDIGGKETRFKRGNCPHNRRPIGSERLDKDGYLYRKVSDTRVKRIDWRAVHVIEWERANGPLPKGKFVIFADGNRSNFEPSNLIAVTRAELMERNTVQRFPTELRRVIQLRGALNRQIRKRQHANHSRPA